MIVMAGGAVHKAHGSGIVGHKRELIALGSICASQVGCKGVGCDVRDLAVASSSSGSKPWR